MKLEFDKFSLLMHKDIKDINSIHNKRNLVDVPTFFLATLKLRKYEITDFYGSSITKFRKLEIDSQIIILVTVCSQQNT